VVLLVPSHVPVPGTIAVYRCRRFATLSSQCQRHTKPVAGCYDPAEIRPLSKFTKPADSRKRASLAAQKAGPFHHLLRVASLSTLKIPPLRHGASHNSPGATLSGVPNLHISRYLANTVGYRVPSQVPKGRI
jgi:hypothetical protein